MKQLRANGIKKLVDEQKKSCLQATRLSRDSDVLQGIFAQVGQLLCDAEETIDRERTDA